MSDHALFQMWEPFRQSLIGRHLFYVEQARKRLLSQFDDIEAEADRAAEEWLEQSGHLFDPDRQDPSDFYEAANDKGIGFYSLLSAMREQTRLSVVAGMFHEWDKELRGWLAGEMRHWHFGSHARLQVWTADFAKIVDLLESFGWKVRREDYFNALDACRLVVNVYKHGEGESLAALRTAYPEFLHDPFMGSGFSETGHRDHTYLRVSEEQIQAFSDAIIKFWRDAPENVLESQVNDVPAWFGKAIAKDNAERKRPTGEPARGGGHGK